MQQRRAGKIVHIWLMAVSLVFLTSVFSFAAVEFDVSAIEAEIVTAVAGGADPVLAAKEAVAKAVRDIVTRNPNYPGGQQALSAAIMQALENITITGLDDTDLFVSANHALGKSVDPALEAYEGPGNRAGRPPRNRPGTFGPGGKPRPGSPT
ncbi:hypothetical protein DGMP_18680 [Desulfomarina profundi]|uniref:Uncharacterized protein n=1 Tax=Desulfomarina profundi TaxID=2772557 RepID=A0A8D5JPD9_9BACT|nr:hypothetical protein [Desulfomarina profundi]BCL61175.1 hypothetical protein DGMP_18680 [Desulfomarina profundi]